jgi:cytochrome c-type protein NapB
MIKQLSVALMLLGIAGFAAQAVPEDLSSLRGMTALEEEGAAPELKYYEKDGEPITRDYVQQPPLIPHQIEGYWIDSRSNKCLTCHSWANYKEAGATKISQTHFEDRDKHVLANISARRYFCTQCHVPQVDAPPLVENTFRPITAITGE